MDFNEVSMLLGIVHASQDVDPFFGQEARKRLNEIKAEATRPMVNVAPKRSITKEPATDNYGGEYGTPELLGRRHV